MDISKLTPAPWEQDETWLVHGRGENWPDGSKRTVRETPGFAKFNNRDDAFFCALARNAFDVMMRRGWGPKLARDGTWFCDAFDDNSRQSKEFMDWVFSQSYADPFAAVVEADKWYKENVEAK